MVVRTLLVLAITATISAMACMPTHAQDTIVVKTLTFDDITRRSGTFLFPPPQPYAKVLMEYTLKCDERTTQDKYPCGEWDYLTYTTITDSTGQFDSTRKVAVNYMVRGATPSVFRYRATPVADSMLRYEYVAKRQPTTDWTTIDNVSTTTVPLSNGFPSRYSFVLTANELKHASLNAGRITGLRLKFKSVSTIRRITVALQAGSFTTAPNDMASATRVFDRSVTTRDGAVDLLFHKSFVWDGTSDVAVHLTTEGVGGSMVAVVPTTTARMNLSGDMAYKFTGTDRLILPAAVGQAVSNEVTVSFWAFGNSGKLPRDNSVFEAYDARGQRVLNAHMPWSNSRLYWDAGTDRIEKDMPASAIGGRWNHWAFVKNSVTGVMKVYLNGVGFHQGTGMNTPMTGIASFVIGSGTAGSYEGMLDEIQIWNAALDSATINAWMNRPVAPGHPAFARLQAYYRCLPDEGSRAEDSGEKNNDADLWGAPTRAYIPGVHLATIFDDNGLRPAVDLEMASAAVTYDSIRTADAIPPHRDDVVLYSRPVQQRIYAENAADHPTVPTDTIQVYEAMSYAYTYDASGKAVDSTRIVATDSLVRKESAYFSPIVIWEIGRYITPYGIGLDLGPQGFRWTYDVTDYAPLLRNNVTISAGNQQEFIDLTFRFIKGQPAREVQQIDQIIDLAEYGYKGVVDGTLLTEQKVLLGAGAKSAKVKTRTSGHGWDNATNCAEFCKRDHYLSVNGQRRFTWAVWKECASNPVYPQGGTWVLDRTGWCPGAPVDEFDHEITPFVTAGSTVGLDYDVQTDNTGGQNGGWVISSQLFAYGAPNRTADVALDDIIAPTTERFYGRMNPICGQPIVVIQNLGSTKLTSAKIVYGAAGRTEMSYGWTGSLDFLQKDTVLLPTPEWPLYAEEPQTFLVRTELPNGIADEYPANDARRTTFMVPPTYYPEFEVLLRTNNDAANQYEWILRTTDGRVVDSGKNLADKTTYSSKHTLDEGCYEFILTNSQGYGLDLWFVRDQLGTGSLQFLSQGEVFKTFNPDFGNVAWAQFRVGAMPTIATSKDTLLYYSPDVREIVQTVYIKPATSAPLRVDAVSVSSSNNYFVLRGTSRPLPVTLQPGDSLGVEVAFVRDKLGNASGSLRVTSNDQRTAIKTVRLLGTFGSDVEDIRDMQPYLDMQVIPNPSTSSAVLRVRDIPAGVDMATGMVLITDAVGRNVATVRGMDHTTSGDTVPLPELGSGTYTLTLVSGNHRWSVLWTVVR